MRNSPLHSRNFTNFTLPLIFSLLFLAWPHAPRADALDEGVRLFEAQRYQEALHFFLPLAKQGSASAQYNLGFLFANGLGTPRSTRAAIAWYTQAARQKHANACFNLSLLFQEGRGIPVDYLQAHNWYLKAAEYGSDSALVNLGQLYFMGHGTKKDYIQAYIWYALAAARGNRNGLKNKDLAAVKLTPLELSNAEKQYRAQRSKYVDPYL